MGSFQGIMRKLVIVLLCAIALITGFGAIASVGMTAIMAGEAALPAMLTALIGSLGLGFLASRD